MMKFTFSLLTALLLTSNAYGFHMDSIRLNQDTGGSNTATGVAITFIEPDFNSAQKFSFGISANTIKSDQPLEHSGRNKIYPVYAFTNISLNYFVSPFAEFGIDIGDALIDKLFEGDGRDVDIYYSFGVELTIQKTVGISFYHKTYNLYFNDMNNPALESVLLDVTGVSFSYYIK